MVGSFLEHNRACYGTLELGIEKKGIIHTSLQTVENGLRLVISSKKTDWLLITLRGDPINTSM